MDRRGFTSKVSGVIAATWLGFVKQSEADVIDLNKRSKAQEKEEDHIIVKILGFEGEKLQGSKYFKDMTFWSCKYQVTRIDGTIVTRESPQVLSTRKNQPPMNYYFDLS
jgi:hypothetical protein